MKGDFSRDTFEPRKHYSRVLMQQGRVQLDADWNEQQSIHQHRLATETKDVVGASGAPQNDAGFLITTPDGKALNIGRGRYYVNGLLCENEADLLYTAQLDLPNPPDVIAMLTAAQATAAIIYLDVWFRHVTALDDPSIREPALGGPDTTTRVKTVWQVKALPLKPAGGAISCGDTAQEWDNLVAPSSGTLSARAQPTQTTDSPCLLPPSAGYRRLENQLYRVEVHTPGPLGTATFKWSRDNGAIVTSVERINGQDVTVRDLGRDDILGFSSGQLVEITDDLRELSGRPGVLVQIDHITAATRVISLKSAPAGIDATRQPRLRRWDSAGGNGIGVAVPAGNDGWIPLEDGVEVKFGPGQYQSGDYWVIPARTVTGNVEWPFTSPQRARGMTHHFSRLAIATLAGGNLTIQDCRKLFAPLADAPPALHITSINWINDDVVLQDNIQNIGLRVFFDGPVTVPPTDGTSGVVSVTLEMPLILKPDATMAAGPAEATIAGQFGTILNGEMSFPSPNILQWKPAKNAAEFKTLTAFLASQRIARVRLRFLLRGHAIWLETTTGFFYLDGRTLGQKGFRGDNTPRIDLKFPSGDNRRCSDFESWFYLQLQIPPSTLVTLSLSSSAVIAGNPVTGTVTLDFPAGPTGSTVKLSSSAAQVTVPPTLLIAAGQTQGTFAVTTTASGLASSLDVIISAQLGSVNLQTHLAVQVVSVSIAPAELTLFTSHSQQFTAAVAGAIDTGVNWSIQEAGGGSINTVGLYTAPAGIGNFHIVATSVADSTKKASALVHVTPKPKDKEKEKEKERTKEVVDLKTNTSDIKLSDIKRHNLEVMPGMGRPILLPDATTFDAEENPTGRAFIRLAERPETTPFSRDAMP